MLYVGHDDPDGATAHQVFEEGPPIATFHARNWHTHLSSHLHKSRGVRCGLHRLFQPADVQSRQLLRNQGSGVRFEAAVAIYQYSHIWADGGPDRSHPLDSRTDRQLDIGGGGRRPHLVERRAFDDRKTCLNCMFSSGSKCRRRAVDVGIQACASLYVTAERLGQSDTVIS